jgi:ribulose-phosphate 3-epimerase
MNMDNKHYKVMPALMPNSLSDLEMLVDKVSSFSDWVQLDVMDGLFVPSKNWPYISKTPAREVRGYSLPESVSFEVHLMVQNPKEVGIAFVESGARRIIPHIEVFEEPEDAIETLTEYHDAGAEEVGISLLLDTPIASIEPLLFEGAVDIVQIMGISVIGFQGHDFDERTFERISRLRGDHPDLIISIDGGVTKENAGALIEAGANRLSAGSAILKSGNPAKAAQEINEAMKQ